MILNGDVLRLLSGNGALEGFSWMYPPPLLFLRGLDFLQVVDVLGEHPLEVEFVALWGILGA